jgi:CheY-like chemotaxis protein
MRFRHFAQGANQVRIVFLGNRQYPDFRQAVDDLHAAGAIVIPAELDAPAGSKPAAEPPDLIILGQIRPGPLHADAVRQFQRAWPLAPVVVLLGSWCEGETRAGTALPGTTRVYWRDWPGFWSEQRRRVERGLTPAWSLPAAATDEERLLWQTPCAGARRARLRVGLHSRNSDILQLVDDVARRVGWQTVRLPAVPAAPLESVDVAVWDVDILDDSSAAELQQFVGLVRPTPVVALLGFARREDQQRLLSCGASAVLGKPFEVDALRKQLLRLCGAAETAR